MQNPIKQSIPMREPIPEKVYFLQLSQTEVNIIIDGLMELQTKFTWDLLNNMQTQMMNQSKAETPQK